MIFGVVCCQKRSFKWETHLGIQISCIVEHNLAGFLTIKARTAELQSGVRSNQLALKANLEWTLKGL